MRCIPAMVAASRAPGSSHEQEAATTAWRPGNQFADDESALPRLRRFHMRCAEMIMLSEMLWWPESGASDTRYVADPTMPSESTHRGWPA